MIDVESFWQRVDVRSDEECWEWTRCRSVAGYGVLGIGGRQWKAHRVAWSLSRGVEVPPDKLVIHACDNPPCVNPRHIRIGTDKDNKDDMAARNRDPKGERNGRALITEDQVRLIRALVDFGALVKPMVESFGLSRTQIRRVATGVSWREA